jgi:hypothetical protein
MDFCLAKFFNNEIFCNLSKIVQIIDIIEKKIYPMQQKLIQYNTNLYLEENNFIY